MFFPKLGIMPDWFRSTVCKHWLHGGFCLNVFPPFSLSWNPEQNGGERSKTKAWTLDCFGYALLKTSHCLLVRTCGHVSSPSPAQWQGDVRAGLCTHGWRFWGTGRSGRRGRWESGSRQRSAHKTQLRKAPDREACLCQMHCIQL